MTGWMRNWESPAEGALVHWAGVDAGLVRGIAHRGRSTIRNVEVTVVCGFGETSSAVFKQSDVYCDVTNCFIYCLFRTDLCNISFQFQSTTGENFFF